MRKEDVLAYVHRDWNGLAALKRRHWAEQKSRMTPADALRVGDELRHHMHAVRHDWPSDEDRQKDLASHIRVSEMLHSVKPPHRR